MARKEKAEQAIEEIRSRFGKQSVTFGSLLGDLEMPNDDRHSVKMPGMMFT